jgi:hypothetical protein
MLQNVVGFFRVVVFLKYSGIVLGCSRSGTLILSLLVSNPQIEERSKKRLNVPPGKLEMRHIL